MIEKTPTPEPSQLDRWKTARSDYNMHVRMHKWAIALYGEKSPRAKQARAELAVAAICYAQARGAPTFKCKAFMARPMTQAELYAIAEPALHEKYGLEWRLTAVRPSKPSKRRRE